MTQTVLFDASRLLSRTDRISPTGVDRVCLAYAEWLISHPGVTVIPVRSKHDTLVSVETAWFLKCVRDLRIRWSGHNANNGINDNQALLFDRLFGDTINGEGSVLDAPPPDDKRAPQTHLRVWKQFFRSRRMAQIPEGDFYFNIGHTSLNTPDILKSVADRGIEGIVFLHDLIPITHPEFCRPGDDDKHRRRVITTLRHASRIIVNSEYTAHELALFGARENLTVPPVEAVHLGLEPIFTIRANTPTAHPYFIHVGTIEARKNLAFLLTIWSRLSQKMGDRAPRLVLIGRYGWENEAVLDHLQRSPGIQGLVHQVSSLSDDALAYLLSRAQGVLAPSSVEGFDLPAVEACSLGVPLIASDIPAHRELVPHAELIDPIDGMGWLAALERATLNQPVAHNYAAPTWHEHFAQVARRVGIRDAE